jgi:ABC-type transport system substrate-binding protein
VDPERPLHHQQEFTANKNPHYRRPGFPYLDAIEYRPIPDSQQLLNSLKSNSVDIIHSSPTQLVKEVQRSTGQPVTLTINHVPDPSTTKIAEHIQQQLEAVGMKVTLSPIQQAQLISAALLGAFEVQVWRQFGAVNPDLHYIFWSQTQINSAFSVNMARNSDPAMEVALQKSRQSADAATRTAACQEVASLMGKDIPYLWTARTVWSIASRPTVQNFDNPTLLSGAKAFGMITGAIWPTQIWSGS